MRRIVLLVGLVAAMPGDAVRRQALLGRYLTAVCGN